MDTVSNPVTNLSGGEFLFFYAVVIVTATLVCRWLARRIDPTSADDKNDVLPNLDFDEVAYLRGGDEELTRAIIGRLIVRGSLCVEKPVSTGIIFGSTEKRIRQAVSPPSGVTLSPLESRVYEWFSNAHTTEEIFGPTGVSGSVSGYATVHFQEKLRAAGLLLPEDVRSKIWRIAITGAIVVGVLGIARVLVGVSRGRPVGFLIGVGVIGLMIFLGRCAPDRLSNRGRNCVAQMTTLFQAQGATA